jgi:signal transduction histidine kinase
MNMAIFVLAGFLSYFLAGITLRPIQEMVTAQQRFVGDASHELRTPLTALRTTLEVLLRKSKGGATENAAIASLEEVKTLQHLTDRLLTLSEAGKDAHQHHFTTQPLLPIVEMAKHALHTIARAKHIRLVFKHPSHQRDVVVRGDASRLMMVFTNVLENAVKYSYKNSSVTLSLHQEKRWAVVTVQDNGIGMTTEEQQHIFERLYRADSARTRSNEQGFGLGLAIAETVVQEHGGSITVESELEKGSKFTITLPLEKKE